MGLPVGSIPTDCCCTPPDPCALFESGASTITLSISGTAFCPCYVGALFSGTISGGFTLNLASPGLYTLTIPNALIGTFFQNTDCTGTSTTHMYDIRLVATCEAVSMVAGSVHIIFESDVGVSPPGGPYINQYGAGDCGDTGSGGIVAYGGIATASP